jgi:large subunit ribosomal protein L23
MFVLIEVSDIPKAGIQYGKTNAIKKAIVQLADGESIDLYANA